MFSNIFHFVLYFSPIYFLIHKGPCFLINLKRSCSLFTMKVSFFCNLKERPCIISCALGMKGSFENDLHWPWFLYISVQGNPSTHNLFFPFIRKKEVRPKREVLRCPCIDNHYRMEKYRHQLICIQWHSWDTTFRLKFWSFSVKIFGCNSIDLSNHVLLYCSADSSSALI